MVLRDLRAVVIKFVGDAAVDDVFVFRVAARPLPKIIWALVFFANVTRRRRRHVIHRVIVT